MGEWGEAMYAPVALGTGRSFTALPAEYIQQSWYAVQVGANQERQVHGRLSEKGVESFVPLYQEVRRRTDRQVVVQVPLFPGYVFVQVALRDRLRVLEVPKVVRLVGFGGTPAALPAQEIESLRAALAFRRVFPHPYLQTGKRVRFVAGPFSGMEGTLVRRKNALRLLVSITAIMRSFTVEVDEAEIEPVYSLAPSCR